MGMKDMVKDYILSLESDGKSKCTISAYEGDMRDFEKYVTKEICKDFSEIRYADLRMWTNYMEKCGLSAPTRARKISTVRSFFRYAKKMEWIQFNPSEALETPKLPKKQPKTISMDDARNLLTCSENNQKNHVTHFRDYTIVSMFLFTGIRREELSNIMVHDVNMEQRTILIHGKGDKERIVYINDALYDILSEYMSTYRKLLSTADASKFLFTSKKREKLSVNSINIIVNKAMESAGIKEYGASAHILRKRFATTSFMKTRDIATVSKILGHSSPTVTMRYVVVDEDTIRTAMTSVAY